MNEKDAELPIRKPRSLAAKGYAGWKDNSAQKKHFKLSGAVPTNAPSTGAKHGGKNKSKTCKKSPDHEHHYEVVAERVWKMAETMVDTCIYCGHKKGYGFQVWVMPKPEWRKKLEAKWKCHW
jgi:hypothetical protein